jgi:general secretion pathway protein C
MRATRALLTAAVPGSIALVAFLNAQAVSALIEGTMSAATLAPASPLPTAVPPELLALARVRPSADAILDRNPFDHVTGPLREASAPPLDTAPRDADPATAPLCEGVRPVVVVGNEDQTVAFAALDFGGKRLLRKRGGDVGAATVEYVGRDRVWLRGRMGLCQAPLFGAPVPKSDVPPPRTGAEPSTSPRSPSPLETELGKQIAKLGPNEYAIERSAVDRILEAQAELMKHRIVQEKEGDRVLGVKISGIKPGSILSMLGIENGDRLETLNGFDMSNPEKMLEAYARLRTGADRLQIHVTRAGKPINVDYTIR